MMQLINKLIILVIKRVYNFVARGSQAECDFTLVVNLSIGLVSAVA